MLRRCGPLDLGVGKGKDGDIGKLGLGRCLGPQCLGPKTQTGENDEVGIKFGLGEEDLAQLSTNPVGDGIGLVSDAKSWLSATRKREW